MKPRNEQNFKFMKSTKKFKRTFELLVKTKYNKPF